MFQSYLIYGSNPQNLRKKTNGIAKAADVDLKANSVDIFTISPIKNLPAGRQGSITIDQIRNLKSHIAQKPLKSKYKLIIIEYANLATLEAQNALLKTLEEPPSHAIIILEAQNYKSLLPTILSRVVKVKAPWAKTKVEIQPLIGIAPLNALELIGQIDNPQVFLDDQMTALTDLLVKKITDGRPKDISVQDLTAAIEKCCQTKKMIDANVNPKFALANLIFSLNLASK